MMLLGIGLLLMGKTWAGIGVLGFGIFVLAIALSPPAVAALLLVIGALLFSGVLAYHAASNEFTGKAVYYSMGRGTRGEPVTRESSPDKFRRATNVLWAMSGFGFMAAAACFTFHRKVNEYEYD